MYPFPCRDSHYFIQLRSFFPHRQQTCKYDNRFHEKYILDKLKVMLKNLIDFVELRLKIRISFRHHSAQREEKGEKMYEWKFRTESPRRNLLARRTMTTNPPTTIDGATARKEILQLTRSKITWAPAIDNQFSISPTPQTLFPHLKVNLRLIKLKLHKTCNRPIITYLQ